MTLWTEAVDILRESMFAYAHATNGNLGVGILIVTMLARLATFPLMLRIAGMSARHQARVRAIQPELDAIKARFKNDPLQAALESAFGGRFLWIADISRPDRWLAVLVGVVSVAAASFMPVPEGQSRTLVALLPALVTAIVLWKMAAGVGLYWGVSSAIGGVQSFVAMRRSTLRERAV